MSAATILHRLDARDRALFVRYRIVDSASRRARMLWLVLTHVGGATCSVLAAVLPRLLGMHGGLAIGSSNALTSLVVSHLLVQLVKRAVGRPRPSCVLTGAAIAREPDRFSFPSGHSAAAMSVAFAYALVFPALAAPLVSLAFLVGLSRVCLGVHYPGDVVIGQLIAIATAIGVHLVG
jgi:undecaprenyl-diphosphatase